MIEEATCQRNMFSEIKNAIKCNTTITYSILWCDAMTKDVHREEISKFEHGKTKALPLKNILFLLKNILFLLIETYLLRMSGSR